MVRLMLVATYFVHCDRWVLEGWNDLEVVEKCALMVPGAMECGAVDRRAAEAKANAAGWTKVGDHHFCPACEALRLSSSTSSSSRTSAEASLASSTALAISSRPSAGPVAATLLAGRVDNVAVIDWEEGDGVEEHPCDSFEEAQELVLHAKEHGAPVAYVDERPIAMIGDS
jgi:hypothetical protein